MIFQTYGDTIWVGGKMKDMDEFLFTRLSKKWKYWTFVHFSLVGKCLVVHLVLSSSLWFLKKCLGTIQKGKEINISRCLWNFCGKGWTLIRAHVIITKCGCNTLILVQWINEFTTSPLGPIHSLGLVNSLKIQWNHLAYMEAFCCNVCTTESGKIGSC
jgi:hypothetical protein